MSDVLFVHNNFPAQFGFIAQRLRTDGHRCAVIASETGRALDGIELVKWSANRGTSDGILPSAVRFEADLIRGGAAAEAALALRSRGFDPKLIIGHPGWGETVYLREVFPQARQIAYAEYYYRSAGGDVGFDPEFSPAGASPHLLAAKNAGMALAFGEAEAVVAPTPFQRSLLPPMVRDRTRVIHEGIDTTSVQRHSTPRLTLANGKVIDGSRPLITFISRRLEPLRGFHIFMRALPRVMAAVPDADVVVIGADEAGGYGRPAPDGKTWGQLLIAEVAGALDRSRLHFVGRVPHSPMIEALSLSTAHVYYTYPFVLSWSLLEAMAAECFVIASDTAPVRDAITDGQDGVLLDFFDVEALSDALIEACRDPQKFAPMRKAARETIRARYDRATICEPAWLRLVEPMLEAG
ncbi:MAG: glycosyltransferase [Devosia sp.]|nr:glycosyltransferase [Devosia sp.]